MYVAAVPHGAAVNFMAGTGPLCMPAPCFFVKLLRWWGKNVIVEV